MNKIIGLIVLSLLAFGSFSCQKDYSLDSYQVVNPTPTTPTPLAIGTLKDANGNCQNIAINGNYTQGTALTASNYITVTVNFASAGKYRIYSNTVNGYSFSTDSAITTSTGTQTIKLQGYGTPIKAEADNFTVSFLNISCPFTVVSASIPYVSTETDYFPMTVGSYWTYDTIKNARQKDTVRFSVTNQTQTIGIQPYKLAISNNKDTEFYRKDYQGHYFRYFNLLSNFGLAFEYMILDDTRPIGYTWKTSNQSIVGTYKGTPINATAYLQCTIISENQPLTVNGYTFDSVIHVQEQFLLQGDPTPPFGNFDAYYAKKVGLIQYNLPDAPSPINYSVRSWYIQ